MKFFFSGFNLVLERTKKRNISLSFRHFPKLTIQKVGCHEKFQSDLGLDGKFRNQDDEIKWRKKGLAVNNYFAVIDAFTILKI